MTKWVDSRPIFKVCARETGYNGGGNIWEQWWRQASAEKQLRVTLGDIFAPAWQGKGRGGGVCN